jgi:hypothetical protein
MISWTFSLIAWLLTAGMALAQEPPLELLDEGVVLGKVRKLDCVGSGLVCSKTGNLGTINGSAGGGGGAPTTAQYWVGAADATLSAEHNLGALATGLVLNTTGTPSAYAGTTCTNQVLRLLNGSGAGTCVTLTSSYVDTSIWTGSVASAGVSGTSKILVLQSGAAATGRQADENEMDGIICNASPGTGTFVLTCRSERTLVHGKFKVLYNVS